MKKIRNITREYKGVISFLLLFVFLYSGLFRSAILDIPSLVSVETKHVSSSSSSKQKQLTAISEEDLTQRQLSQFKKTDSDADDEITFFRSYSISEKAAFSVKKRAITQLDLFHSAAKIPLYDLFCNWKFHLS